MPEQRWVNIYKDGDDRVIGADHDELIDALVVGEFPASVKLETVRLITKEESEEYERLIKEDLKAHHTIITLCNAIQLPNENGVNYCGVKVEYSDIVEKIVRQILSLKGASHA